MNVKRKETVENSHRRLGHIMWEHNNIPHHAKGLKEAIQMQKGLKKELKSNVFIPSNEDN